MDKEDGKEPKIDAVDVFDWDYLVRIARFLELHALRKVEHAIQLFAYRFTAMASVEDQNRFLYEWIRDATHLQSREGAEEILAVLAKHAHGSIDLLRIFAKQNGIRLKKG
jgi:hypothetical protein